MDNPYSYLKEHEGEVLTYRQLCNLIGEDTLLYKIIKSPQKNSVGIATIVTYCGATLIHLLLVQYSIKIENLFLF